MNEPIFLDAEFVLDLHRMAIELSGGEPNVKEWGLLESAVAVPRQRIGGQYLHGLLASMAAAYIFHIVSNHAFVDGNKLAGTAAALTFLDANGMQLDVDAKDLEDLAVDLASGAATKQQAIEFFEAHIKPLDE